jgi:exodeoxyribonuclease VII small subunit
MSDDGEIGFETALEELEAIVGELERGRPDLGTALARYERGVRLLGHCQGLLDGAERSVALLTGVDESGRPITAPFDASATAPSSENRK